MFNHLKGKPDMTLKQLTLKMIKITALVSAQRTQALQLLSVNTCTLSQANIFLELSLLKQTSAIGGR